MGLLDESEESFPPRKWLDKKQYVRIDNSGRPQLIRVEPIITEEGFDVEKVKVFIDDRMRIMGREAADNLIITMKCSPLEIMANYRHCVVH